MIISEKKLRKLIRLLITEYISREDLEDVRQTAHLVHMGQKRRDNTPYITHPEAVYDITKTYYPENRPAQLLALLHDTLEDADSAGNVTKQQAYDMIQASIHDKKSLSLINRALQLLTHDKSVPYSEYLQIALDDPIAGKVKISDLIHNLSHNPSPRQIRKYRNALDSVEIPPSINPDQVSYLYSIMSTAGESIGGNIDSQ